MSIYKFKSDFNYNVKNIFLDKDINKNNNHFFFNKLIKSTKRGMITNENNSTIECNTTERIKNDIIKYPIDNNFFINSNVNMKIKIEENKKIKKSYSFESYLDLKTFYNNEIDNFTYKKIKNPQESSSRNTLLFYIKNEKKLGKAKINEINDRKNNIKNIFI